MSMIGKEVRLGRIFNQKSKNVVMVAMDHAVAIGPVNGITNPYETVKNLSAAKPDTFFMPIGIIKKVYPEFIKNDIPFIASITTATRMGPEPDYVFPADTVEHALNIGASGVSLHVFIGPPKTSDMIRELGRVSVKCDELGMPLLAIMYPMGFNNNYDIKHVKWAARIGAEMGADVVKTYYTGSKDSFREVVESCPVPVLLSGGALTEDPKDFLIGLKHSMDAGAHGCAVGRNLWQYKNPQAMLKAIKTIVHEGSSIEQALKVLNQK
jgi:DhnA family fructose-bisphosphate aldolase class Ia